MQIAIVAAILILIWLFAYLWFNRTSNSRKVLSETTSGMDVPLWYDPSVGEWKCSLEFLTLSKEQKENGWDPLDPDLSRTRFETIPDTGSRLLLVSGAECRTCSVNNGLWHSGLGSPIDPVLKRVDYMGGQSTSYRVHDGIMTELPFPVRVGVAVKSSTSGKQQFKPENVLGLSGENTEDSFWSTWARKRCVFDFESRRLYLGSIPPSLNQQITVSKSRIQIPLVEGISPGIVIDKGETVDGNGKVIDTIPSGRVLIDTGTTRSLGLKDLTGKKLRLYVNSTILDIELPLNQINSAPFPLPSGTVLLLGNTELMQWNLDLDYDNSSVSFYK